MYNKPVPDYSIYSRGFSKAISILIAVLVIGAVLGVYAYYHKQSSQIAQTATSSAKKPTSTSPTSLPNLPAGWATYTDPDFHVTFGYPASWTAGGFKTTPVQPGNPNLYSFQPPPSRTGGYSNSDRSAFFYTSNAFFGPYRNTIDDLVQTFVNHPTKPYGSNPTIQILTVNGQNARLVTPSADGGPGLFLYVECPNKCGIFFLNADKDHMMQIIQTLQFQKP
jgi:hypothetical protein